MLKRRIAANDFEAAQRRNQGNRGIDLRRINRTDRLTGQNRPNCDTDVTVHCTPLV